MTLVEFLRARLDEDEAAARATPDDPFGTSYGFRFLSWESDHSDEDTAFVNRFNPARVMAEVEAKRRIMDAHPHRDEGDDPELSLGCETCDWHPWWPGTFREPCPTVRLLALPYADHPDYREEWKP